MFNCDVDSFLFDVIVIIGGIGVGFFYEWWCGVFNIIGSIVQ